MTVEEIQSQIATLEDEDLTRIIIHAFHLKRIKQPEQKKILMERLDDQNPANWVDFDDYLEIP